MLQIHQSGNRRTALLESSPQWRHIWFSHTFSWVILFFAFLGQLFRYFLSSAQVAANGGHSARTIFLKPSRTGINPQNHKTFELASLSTAGKCWYRSTEFPSVKPLHDFDWSTTEPLKIRPYKPKYFLTISTETSTISEMIQIDKNFFSRLSLKEQIFEAFPKLTVRANPISQDAVLEFYNFLTTVYLPVRFPNMFKLQGNKLLNVVSQITYPAEAPSSITEALRTLGTMVDEDFMFLIPSSDGDSYSMEAFTICFTSGFDLEKAFGSKLRDIHGPVPKYKEKLEHSIDKWFARLPTGKYMCRKNWTVTATGRLRLGLGENQFYGDSDNIENSGQGDGGELPDPHLRVERHFLHRLPRSQAIVFSFKTYVTPLKEIREEGNGEALARAIDGLKEGNVPEIARYKGAAEWGGPAKRFLRATNHTEV